MEDNSNTFKETAALVCQQFELETSLRDDLTEEKLIDFLSKRIEWMLEHNIELLFSTLYRMDVSESQVEKAMHPDALLAPHIGLAALVLNRQRERIQTKADYRQPPLSNEGEDWSW